MERGTVNQGKYSCSFFHAVFVYLHEEIYVGLTQLIKLHALP